MVITLIGYRGTGKTTIGSALAARLNWDFIDLDSVIECQAGKTISEIFQQQGEPYFRLMESSALQASLAGENRVVSPGGGAILDPANRAAMQAAGPVIWLSASVKTIAERLSQDPVTKLSRPTLTGTDVVQEIETVLTRRLPLYEEAATHIIWTENRTPAAIVDEIMGLLPETQGSRP